MYTYTFHNNMTHDLKDTATVYYDKKLTKKELIEMYNEALENINCDEDDCVYAEEIADYFVIHFGFGRIYENNMMFTVINEDNEFVKIPEERFDEILNNGESDRIFIRI